MHKDYTLADQAHGVCPICLSPAEIDCGCEKKKSIVPKRLLRTYPAGLLAIDEQGAMLEIRKLRRRADLLIGYKKIAMSLCRQKKKLEKDLVVCKHENKLLKNLDLLKKNENLIKGWKNLRNQLQSHLNNGTTLTILDILNMMADIETEIWGCENESKL